MNERGIDRKISITDSKRKFMRKCGADFFHGKWGIKNADVLVKVRRNINISGQTGQR